MLNIVQTTDAAIVAAITYADAQPDPDVAELTHYVYAEEADPEACAANGRRPGSAAMWAPIHRSTHPPVNVRSLMLRRCARRWNLHSKAIPPFLCSVRISASMGGVFGVTAGLVERFGAERVRDTPISENNIAGTAFGAAVTGMRPIAEMQFMDFVTMAMEQIVLQGSKIRFMFGGKATVPMVLRLPAGSGTGAAAQHSQSLEAWFVNVPGLRVVMPATPYDAKGLLLAAIADDNPVMFVENKLLYKQKGFVPLTPYVVPLGQARIARPGRDLTVVATGIMVSQAIDRR